MSLRRIALALIGLMALAVSSAQAGPKIERWVAPSGAQVYFVEIHALPILDLAIEFVGGSAADPADKAGLAAMTRGLLDAGAGDLDEEQISARTVDLGSRFGGSGDADRIGLSLRTLSSAAEKEGSLDLLSLILTRPTFPEAVLAREKARTIAAIQDADTRPDAIAAKRFAAALYPGHPYGASATVESVGLICRDDLLAFHRDNFIASRAIISIVGDVSRAEAEAIAQRLTVGLPAGQAAAAVPPVVLPQQGVVKVAHPATQAHIHMGLPAVKRSDPDYYALIVGNYVLGGGGFVSRLMKEVREKRGYAYSVYSYFAPRKLEGPFEIGLQTKREQAAEALKVATDTLQGFMAGGPTPAELNAAKRNLIDGQALRIDSNAKLLGALQNIAFYGLPLTYLDDFPKLVENVTAADVKRAFASHVKPEHMVTVIVGTE